MGNETSSSRASYSGTPNSEILSNYSWGSRRKSSSSQVLPQSPKEPPEPDLSHLTDEEITQITAVLNRAKCMEDEEETRVRKLEEDYLGFAHNAVRRKSLVEMEPENEGKELCPICLKVELQTDTKVVDEVQYVCADCERIICAACGRKLISVITDEEEWVCEICQRRRNLVLSSGMWYHGYHPGHDIPVMVDLKTRVNEMQDKVSGLERSYSVEEPAPKKPPRPPPIKRQASLPAQFLSQPQPPDKPSQVTKKHPIIEEQEKHPEHHGKLKSYSREQQVSEEPAVRKQEEDTTSTCSRPGPTGFRGVLMSMVGPCGMSVSTKSDSEDTEGTSDVEMEDVSSQRRDVSSRDVSSLYDDVSDDRDFSQMSMSSSITDDVEDLKYDRKRPRPRYLDLSRSHSATSSEADEEQEISDNVKVKEAEVRPAAILEQSQSSISSDLDEQLSDARNVVEHGADNRPLYSPSPPCSPSWRQGVDSPPFSPRRRDSYPGRRRGMASPTISPKDKRHQFSFSDMSPPSGQLSTGLSHRHLTQSELIREIYI